MEKQKGILQDLLNSFLPTKYKLFRQRSLKDAFRHFLALLVFGVLVSSAIYIPKMYLKISQFEKKSESFEEFTLNPTIKTLKPVSFGEENSPLITVSNQGSQDANSSKIFLTSDYIYYNYGKQRKSYAQALELTQYREIFFSQLKLLLLIAIPSFLIGFFGLSFVLLLGFVSAFSLLSIVILRAMKKPAQFKSVITGNFYASIFLAFSMIASAIRPNFGLYFVGVFMIYATLSAVSKIEGDRNKNSIREKR